MTCALCCQSPCFVSYNMCHRISLIYLLVAQRQPDLVSEMSEVLPRPPIRFRPVCPQGHSLRDSSFSSSPYAHSESYVCRACRGQSTPAQLRRWICEKCSVDLCFVCVDENGRALILE